MFLLYLPIIVNILFVIFDIKVVYAKKEMYFEEFKQFVEKLITYYYSFQYKI